MSRLSRALLSSTLLLVACPTRDSRAPAPTPEPSPPPEPAVSEPEPAKPAWIDAVCIPRDDTMMGFSVAAHLDGWVFTYTIDGTTYGAFDVATGELREGREPAADAPAAPEPVDPVTIAEDRRTAKVCDPGGPHACVTVAAPAGFELVFGVVDWTRGRVVFGGSAPDGDHGVLVLYDTTSGKQRAQVACGRNGFVPRAASFRADAIEVTLIETEADSPRTNSGLRYHPETLRRLPDATPAHFELVLRDDAGAARAVDLWPLYPRTELQATWYAAPYHGPMGADFTGRLPSGEWLVVPNGGAFGTLAVVDPARARIVRTYALPLCDAGPKAEPLECLPAATALSDAQMVHGTFEACAGDGACYAFDVARGALSARAQTPSAAPDGGSFWGSDIERDPDDVWRCGGEPLRVGAPIRSATFAFDPRYLFVVSGKPGAPATLSIVGNTSACKVVQKATIGSKAHPCATIEQLADRVLVRTDDCAGSPGGAYLVDAKTLARVAAVGPEHGFTIGHGKTLGVDLGNGLGAFATTAQALIVLQRLDTGVAHKTVTLPHAVDALWATPYGEVIAQHERTFTRVDVDGAVLGTTTLPTCR